MQKIEVCGQNQNFAISETSNNKDKYNNEIVYPPLPSNFEAPLILSYSTYFEKTVIITVDGVAYVICNNTNGEISCLLPKSILNHFTEIDIKDSESPFIW